MSIACSPEQWSKEIHEKSDNKYTACLEQFRFQQKTLCRVLFGNFRSKFSSSILWFFKYNHLNSFDKFCYFRLLSPVPGETLTSRIVVLERILVLWKFTCRYRKKFQYRVQKLGYLIFYLIYNKSILF